jgi:hypothetical protein
MVRCFLAFTTSSLSATVHVNIALCNFNMGSKTPENHQQTPDGMISLSPENKLNISTYFAT